MFFSTVLDKTPIIIVSPGFTENSGGAIALHNLCHRLNSRGIPATLWHTRRPLHYSADPVNNIINVLKSYIYSIRRHTFWRNKFNKNIDWITPEHRGRLLENSWVVYPDIILDNPLRAKKVVRWHLYHPRTHLINNAGISILKEYYYSQNFAPKGIAFRILSCTWLRNDLYNVENCQPRVNSCHMWRKRDADLTPIHSRDSICLDGMSHVQIASIFKKSHTFISYDLHTAYSMFAALCGCTSIVARKSGLSETDWHPDVSTRYGIAYGFESKQWAIETLPKLKESLEGLQERENSQLDDFIRDLASS